MIDLDFAFLNILSVDREGLIYQKFFLDRLAPIFFPPRVARLLALNELESRICNIVLPLGPGNLQNLDGLKRRSLLEQSQNLLDDFKLGVMAVDRRLKYEFSRMQIHFPLVFGDRFIQTLALVLIRQGLSRRDYRKIIVVGTTENFPCFLEALCQFQLPVSIQSPCPARFDVMSYRLLYEKGCTLSNSTLAPEEWEAGDLVLAFTPALNLGSQVSRAVRFLALYDSSSDLAPDLEIQMRRCGLDGRLHHMAPVLESSLLAKAGYFSSNEEPNKVKGNINMNNMNFLELEEMGHQICLWDQFLDKAK